MHVFTLRSGNKPMNYFSYSQSFQLESGGVLPGLKIAYHSYGKMNDAGDNVVWICHALTASSAAEEWWPGLVGKGYIIDPEKYFIVCANIIGSCYGSTGPLSTNPQTGKSFYKDFPLITIRDMVKAHQLLSDHLQVKKIHLMIGGSMGGYQALEWCAMEPQRIERLFLIATSAKETPWGIAIHTAQRLAIEADSSFGEASDHAGQKGLKAARAIAMLTYRNYSTYAITQADSDPEKLNGFRASSYIEHQGNKLVKRFNAYSYWTLSRAMDTHNLARGRAERPQQVLEGFKQKTLVIGISNDLLCPLEELQLIANHIPGAAFHVIESLYGHDGFLTEHVLISSILGDWLEK
jgi:homoserine O-acetyltransferase